MHYWLVVYQVRRAIIRCLCSQCWSLTNLHYLGILTTSTSVPLLYRQDGMLSRTHLPGNYLNWSRHTLSLHIHCLPPICRQCYLPTWWTLIPHLLSFRANLPLPLQTVTPYRLNLDNIFNSHGRSVVADFFLRKDWSWLRVLSRTQMLCVLDRAQILRILNRT